MKRCDWRGSVTLPGEKTGLRSFGWNDTRGGSQAIGTTKLQLMGYVDRNEKILELCRNRRVLHLGCVGFTDCSVEDKIRLGRRSLHYLLSQVCDCVGIDIDELSIQELQRTGIFENVVLGNVEYLEEVLSGVESFDVVVAGDIIEHLSNPGKMLEGSKMFLKPNGLLIISTPNAMGLPGYLRYLGGRFQEGGQHVVSFNLVTLFQLLNRHDYRVVEAYTCHQVDAQGRYGLLYPLGLRFLQVFPKFGGTLLYVSSPR